MDIEFDVEPREFAQALRYMRPARLQGRKARAEFIDINAGKGEIELVSTSASTTFPAQVINPGYARAPYLGYEWLSKAVRTLSQLSVRVSIVEGQIRVAKLTLSHPDITMRHIGARIADLPIDAPLPDVLALLVKYRTEELSDSGLLARVLAAQEQTSRLIDRAAKTLKPLDMKREALSEFIYKQIESRCESKGGAASKGKREP